MSEMVGGGHHFQDLVSVSMVIVVDYNIITKNKID